MSTISYCDIKSGFKRLDGNMNAKVTSSRKNYFKMTIRTRENPIATKINIRCQGQEFYIIEFKTVITQKVYIYIYIYFFFLKIIFTIITKETFKPKKKNLKEKKFQLFLKGGCHLKRLRINEEYSL